MEAGAIAVGLGFLLPTVLLSCAEQRSRAAFARLLRAAAAETAR